MCLKDHYYVLKKHWNIIKHISYVYTFGQKYSVYILQLLKTLNKYGVCVKNETIINYTNSLLFFQLIKKRKNYFNH